MKSVRLLRKASYHNEETDSEGTWALSYGDMITLLLSFFVIFFTTDFKEQKVEKLNRHLSFTLEGASDGALPEKVKTLSKFPTLDVPDLKAVVAGELVLVSFGAVSFFGSGETRVDARGEEILRKFAEKFLPYAGNYRLAVKGFTDKRRVLYKEDKFRKYEDNLELSALRSLSAMRVLQRSGVPLSRMEIAGGGELEAIKNLFPHTEGLLPSEINALSRTIVIVIKPEKESWL